MSTEYEGTRVPSRKPMQSESLYFQGKQLNVSMRHGSVIHHGFTVDDHKENLNLNFQKMLNCSHLS